MGKVWMTIDLGFGDAGKGTCVDALVRETGSKLVVRYGGGAQCAHRVETARGGHTFAQFGSGTLAGAATFLGPDVMVNPISLINEAKTLGELVSDPLAQLFVHRDVLITTPYHVAANRIRERARGDGRHGSCGLGIGETKSDYLAGHGVHLRDLTGVTPARVAELYERVRRQKITQLRAAGFEPDDSKDWRLLLRDADAECDLRLEAFLKYVKAVDSGWLRHALRHQTVVFEGHQGVLLDQDHGFHPYTTWSDTTLDGADALLKSIDFKGDNHRMGITRTYQTRHGPGPFPTYDPNWNPSESHNGFSEWQREFRSGALDFVLMRYALEVIGGVDSFALTHLDVDTPSPCTEYRVGERRVDRLEVSRCNDPGSQILAQERLSLLLGSASPVYTMEPRWNPVDSVQWHMGKFVALVSRGPRPDQKAWRNK